MSRNFPEDWDETQALPFGAWLVLVEGVETLDDLSRVWPGDGSQRARVALLEACERVAAAEADSGESPARIYAAVMLSQEWVDPSPDSLVPRLLRLMPPSMALGFLQGEIIKFDEEDLVRRGLIEKIGMMVDDLRRTSGDSCFPVVDERDWLDVLGLGWKTFSALIWSVPGLWYVALVDSRYAGWITGRIDEMSDDLEVGRALANEHSEASLEEVCAMLAGLSRADEWL